MSAEPAEQQGRPALSLRQIEVFWALMQARTVSGAARLLNVSQPGLSRMLGHMEARLGLVLFQRGTGRLVPTPEAMALHERAAKVHAQLYAMEDAAARLARAEGGTLAVGAGGSVSSWPVAHALSAVRRALPSVSVRIDTLPLPGILDYLLDRRGDAIVSLHGFDHPALTCEVIGRAPLVCALPPGHPLEGREALSAADLLAHDLVTFDPETVHGQALAEALGVAAGAGVAARARFITTAIAMAEAGLGVAPVDGCAMRGHGGRLAFVPFRPTTTFDVHLLTSRRTGPSVALRRFAAEVRALMESAGWGLGRAAASGS
jgi:DNA-binding transcriptional LysR family regulator